MVELLFPFWKIKAWVVPFIHASAEGAGCLW